MVHAVAVVVHAVAVVVHAVAVVVHAVAVVVHASHQRFHQLFVADHAVAVFVEKRHRKLDKHFRTILRRWQLHVGRDRDKDAGRRLHFHVTASHCRRGGKGQNAAG